MPGKKPPGPLAQTVSQESFNVATKGRQAGIARPIHIAFMSRVVRMIATSKAGPDFVSDTSQEAASAIGQGATGPEVSTPGSSASASVLS